MKILTALFVSLSLTAAGETKLGQPLRLKAPVAIETLLAEPAKYAGKMVQVKGTVREVCQHMGCWMEIAGEAGKAIRIKVNDGEIVFPKDAAGKTAIAEGKLVKSGATLYQIQGTGAVILE